MQMNPKDLILHLFKNERKRKVLIELHEGRKSFTELKEEAEIDNNTTLSRDLAFLDSAGLVVKVFERTGTRYYSHYELNLYGRKIAEIVIELERVVNERLSSLLAT